jgi:sugar phosphate isomerase/epimerase
MRLCWNDGLGGNYREMKIEDIKFVYDIGYRVAGLEPDFNATDDDIKRVKDLFARVGMVFGPLGIGLAAFHPNKDIEKKYKEQLKKSLIIGGKLGCTNLRYSVGSMDENSVWKHHPLNHTQKALDMLIESTRELVTVAEDSNCILCPETTQGTIVGTVPRMKEYVDRLDSPGAMIVFDPVNHMGAERIYESGKFIKCAIAELGDRIGEIHVKDAQIKDDYMFSFGEAPMGTGLLDHAALIQASDSLEPWKTFSLEHISDKKMWKPAYDYIQKVADKMGHKFTDPNLTREKWEKIKKY